ncbi:reprolysin-like metallopeptidase [Pseudomonas fluorescens]|uniref:Reprolysin-like metallo-peptidase family M12B n=1 Tax=Pseudomonas fluorescens TaxID=294 RepID=A0A5E7D8S9_PSEFL|nr:hypothetical protein [Pseudomonas fluorescens]VVO10408.1 hypothetical protein PS710_03399 [Pseudomonas fluorescens]
MKKHITLPVIIHSDLQDYQKDKLYNDYFAWLKTELEFISEREVKILMYRQDEAPKLAGYNYKNEDGSAALVGWRDLIHDWYSGILSRDRDEAKLTKVLLLTRDNINEKLGGLLGGLGGIALVKGHCAIASISSYRAPAHEIGHMLGATHEDGEVIYDGWWRDTIMLADEFSHARGNVYRFSDKNRQHIRDYLNQFP